MIPKNQREICKRFRDAGFSILPRLKAGDWSEKTGKPGAGATLNPIALQY